MTRLPLALLLASGLALASCHHADPHAGPQARNQPSQPNQALDTDGDGIPDAPSRGPGDPPPANFSVVGITSQGLPLQPSRSIADPAFLEQFAATYRFGAGTPRSISISPDGKSVLFLRSGPRSVVQDLFEFDPATGLRIYNEVGLGKLPHLLNDGHG